MSTLQLHFSNAIQNTGRVIQIQVLVADKSHKYSKRTMRFGRAKCYGGRNSLLSINPQAELSTKAFLQLSDGSQSHFRTPVHF
ncbi:hypothetical protein HZ326_17979 [Fusarium oxysporum f. sp. albedinis]|nr:hypothetical protein HZ326_17979 [Fusarium oxysporum f. sp. albedinis]